MRALAIMLALCAGVANAEGHHALAGEPRISSRTAPTLPAEYGVRPVLRPDAIAAFLTVIVPPSVDKRPFLRPFVHNHLERSLRPFVRPAAITQQARAAEVARRRGQVCGDPAIQGVALGRVPGNGACGIESGVRVRSVAGVSLGPNATMDCPTAAALKNWVSRTAAPAVGDIGGGIESLRVVSHYSCRFRNSAASGKLSEHSFGRAIDIAGIGLKNGDEITVLTDWGRGSKGRALAAMWRGACGPFGTVLGPNANRFHADHFHFDTARYRSGSYCR
jgi:hypothetical protein